jgi:endonuclease/exonuclease/phosphatase family metal-dependent hydrolase
MNETAKHATDAKNTGQVDSLSWRSWSPSRFISLLLIMVCTMAAPAVAADPADVRVMSFNIRFARDGHSEDAKENNWNDAEHPRRERTIRVIREASPDLLGVQEARAGQIEDLKKALPDFEYYGIGRDDGKTGGEFSGIFYRRDRFARKDAGSFWLSATPDKAGTTFAANKLPRIASWARLGDNKTSRELVLLNMHWDHEDKAAREKSAALVRERLAAIAKNLPAIVMGDLNSTEDTPAYKTLVNGDASGRRLVDSYRELKSKRTKDEASFGGWTGKRQGSRIDFILHTHDFTPTAVEIDRTSYDGLWPSDHYPVTATLRL